jgi:hypothetical protein
MPRRRFHYDCLATTKEPRWLKIYDRHSDEISSRRLEPNINLRAMLRQVAQDFAIDGWRIEGEGAERWTGKFFMHRLGVRWLVAIMPSEKPLKAH